MENQPLEKMSSSDFEALLDKIQSDEAGELTSDQFFTGLGSLSDNDPTETLELVAEIQNGRLVFQEPAPLNAHANEIQVDGKRVIILLKEADKRDAA